MVLVADDYDCEGIVLFKYWSITFLDLCHHYSTEDFKEYGGIISIILLWVVIKMKENFIFFTLNFALALKRQI